MTMPFSQFWRQLRNICKIRDVRIPLFSIRWHDYTTLRPDKPDIISKEKTKKISPVQNISKPERFQLRNQICGLTTYLTSCPFRRHLPA